MRTMFIATLAVCTICSCNNSTGSANNNSADSTLANTNGTITGNTANSRAAQGNGYWQQLEMRQFKDAQGNLVAEAPYPSDWKMQAMRQQGEPSIVGPNGLKVIEYTLKNYMYTNDPQLQSVYYQSGQQLRAFPGVDQVVEQDIKPRGEQQGLKFIRHYEVPEVTKIDKWYYDQLYKAVPSRSDMVAIGTDWETADGSPYFLLVHINLSETQNMQNWGFYSAGVQADKAYFERAKKQYIFSLANTRYALEPIMAYNEMEAQKAGQSWAAFNQRMAQNQANFEAQQRAHVNRSEAINNTIMSGWRERNASSDKQQEQFVDAIREETKVQNTQTGQNYKVASHHNQYWMNADGEYIGTNLNNYNPNLDENMNNVKWQELQKVGYK